VYQHLACCAPAGTDCVGGEGVEVGGWVENFQRKKGVLKDKYEANLGSKS